MMKKFLYIFIFMIIMLVNNNLVYSEKDWYINIGCTPETGGAGFGVGVEYGKRNCWAIGVGSLTQTHYLIYEYDYSINISYKKYFFEKERKGSLFWAIGLGFEVWRFRKEYYEQYVVKSGYHNRWEYRGINFNYIAGWRGFVNDKKTFAVTIGIATGGFYGWNREGKGRVKARTDFIGSISFNEI